MNAGRVTARQSIDQRVGRQRGQRKRQEKGDVVGGNRTRRPAIESAS